MDYAEAAQIVTAVVVSAFGLVKAIGAMVAYFFKKK